MLPELTDENASLVAGVERLESISQLNSLTSFLEHKQQTQNRSNPPAWMEVIKALLHLCESRLTQPVQQTHLSFETHIIARQVGKQRDQANVATRFVTDELKRLSKHLEEYYAQLDPKQSTALVGWWREGNKRALCIVIADAKTALMLSRGEEQKPKSTSPSVLKASFIVTALFVLSCVGYFGYQNGRHPVAKSPPASSVLADIKQQGYLSCGVDGALPHFSMFNDAEQAWWGMDVELCYALGAALDLPVRFSKVSNSHFENRIEALFSQRLNILFRNTSLTVSRDLSDDIMFGPYYFYENEYFLNLASNSEKTVISDDYLEDKKVCTKPGTSNELTLLGIKQNVNFEIVTKNLKGEEFSNNIRLLQALRDENKYCDLVFGNYYILKHLKQDRQKRGGNKVNLLPYQESILDPLAPVLPVDEKWRKIVNYVIYVLIHADRVAINSYNADKKLNQGSLTEQNFLRGQGMESLGLSPLWVHRVLTKVGSYNEIYYRSFVCNYADCDKPSEHNMKLKLEQISAQRWPNIVFDPEHQKPGLLHTPRF